MIPPTFITAVQSSSSSLSHFTHAYAEQTNIKYHTNYNSVLGISEVEQHMYITKTSKSQPGEGPVTVLKKLQ
jgi:hypothetical protein